MEQASKNILIVVHHYPPHISGVGMVAHNQAKRLQSAGHKVTVITSQTDTNEKSTVIDGVTVIRIKALNISEDWNAPFPIFSARLVSTLFREAKKADIVHVHDAFYMSSFFAVIAAKLYKKPIFLTQHVAMIAHPNRIIVAIEKIVYATTGKLIFRLANIISTYNNKVESFLIARGVPHQKLIRIINGVDVALFHPVPTEEKIALKKELGMSTTKKVILFVGRFVPKKGFDKVLAAQSSAYQIVFVGGGDVIQNTTKDAVFLGSISPERLATVYQAADIFILPSVSEGFPLSIQEAMASGLPIITTNDEGYARYNLDKDLVSLIDVPTPASVREAIESIVTDEEKLAKMSEYSRMYAEKHFIWSQVITTLDTLYGNLISQKKPVQKKIAIVSDAIYPFNKGGKEKRLYDITSRLADQKYDITIYCMQWWKGEKIIEKDGITYHAISNYYPLYFNERRSMKEALVFALSCLKLLFKDFDVVDVDHIPHVVLYTMKFVCFMKAKPMIATWHEVWGKKYWQDYLGPVIGTIAYLVEKVSVLLPDTIISVSEHTTNDLKTVLGQTKNVITIVNGLDTKLISKATANDLSSDIIFAGRLLKHKNIDVLLRTIKYIKQSKKYIQVIIIGDGPEKDALEKLAIELDLSSNVSFLGFIEDHYDVYRTMKGSKVFVLPSTREGFGITVIEANASGLPVITIDDAHNAARDLIISNENGVLSALDPIALGDAILHILNTRNISQYYMSYSEKYSWDALLPQIKTVYGI